MKYMGSKARLAKHLLPIIFCDRKADQWYVEPFAGGMNTMCKADGKRLANDSNFFLIAMWKELLNGWTPPSFVSKLEYEFARSNRHSIAPHLLGWIGFNCSYSGKWFGGYAGKTKTKEGSIRDYQQEAIGNVNKQIDSMNGVVLSARNYWELQIPPKSIIYCDPPYANTTQYQEPFDSLAFWHWALNLASLGHQIFVSEYTAPPEFCCIWEQPVKSSLSANGKYGGSKTSIERLFTLCHKES